MQSSFCSLLNDFTKNAMKFAPNFRIQLDSKCKKTFLAAPDHDRWCKWEMREKKNKFSKKIILLTIHPVTEQNPAH